MTNGARMVPVEGRPAGQVEEEAGMMASAWQSCRTSFVLVARFFTRAFLDESGEPSIARVMAVAWSVWMMWFFTHQTGADTPEPYLTQAIVAVGALWIVFAAALKMGAGLFVPVAEVLAGAIGGVVKAGQTATEIVMERMKRDYQPPDRTVPLGESELARPGDRRSDDPPGSQPVP